MNIDEYVKESAKQIRNKKERAQFEREMKNHILDRVEYYTDAGYDEETAIKNALGHMGEAEDVSNRMGMVHKSVGGVLCDVLCFVVIILQMLLCHLIMLFNEEITNLDSFTILEFGGLLVFQVALFWNCRKGRHYAVSCALFAYTVLHVLTHILSGRFYSEILLKIWMLISGHSADMVVFSNTWIKSESVPLAVATLIMYALLMFAEIYALKNARNLQIKPNRKTHKKLNTLFSCFTAVVAMSFTFSVFIGLSPIVPDYDYWEVNELYVVESDTIVDFEEFDCKRDGLSLFVDYDLFVVGPTHTYWKDLRLEDDPRWIETVYCPTETKNLFYGKNTITNEYSPSKRYVAVIPVDYDGLKYEYAKWFDTQETDVLEGVLDNRLYCQSDYKITLTNDDEFKYLKEQHIPEQQNMTDDMLE